jgi:hypothetical protein
MSPQNHTTYCPLVIFLLHRFRPPRKPRRARGTRGRPDPGHPSCPYVGQCLYKTRLPAAHGERVPAASCIDQFLNCARATASIPSPPSCLTASRILYPQSRKAKSRPISRSNGSVVGPRRPINSRSSTCVLVLLEEDSRSIPYGIR